LDLNYVYDTLTNVTDPLDYDQLVASETEFYIGATDARTGEFVCFDRACFAQRHCAALMASSAIPGMTKPVEIEGRPYFDGGVANPVPIEKALSDGCKKLVLLFSRPVDSPRKPERMKRVYNRVLSGYPKIVSCIEERHERYNAGIAQAKELETAGKAVIIAPSENIYATIVTRRVSVLDRLYQLGKRDAKRAILAHPDFFPPFGVEKGERHD
jgi:predicted patatin/cPLA2 family phospholipase